MGRQLQMHSPVTSNSVYNVDFHGDDSHIKLNPHMGEIVINSITQNEIRDAVKRLKSNKAVGPDRLPSYIVKGCIDFLVYPLHYLFNLSLKTKVFPKIWKEVRLCPVHKKDDKTDIKNYRPIAILSVPSKLYESIIYNDIYRSICNSISIHQHGFMRHRSTASNLINITQFISQQIHEGSQVDVVYTDFQKAFDSVSHNFLLCKLKNEFGFHENLIELLTSYLHNRKQYVSVNGYTSKHFFALSGVPQGSNLGPLLFFMFINSLTEIIKTSKYLLFADDLKIYIRIESNMDCSLLQNDINNLYQWTLQNKLYLNISKCFIMTYTRRKSPIIYNYKIKDTDLARVETMRDLGLIFDTQLIFSSHIYGMINRANRMYGFIIRNTKMFNNTGAIRQLYVSYVRSQLEYCSIVWNPFYQIHISNIETIQNKVLRFINYKETGLYDFDIEKDILRERYNLKTLESRRKYGRIVYLHKSLHGNVDDSSFLSTINLNVPYYPTRTFRTFYLELAGTNYQINSSAQQKM